MCQDNHYVMLDSWQTKENIMKVALLDEWPRHYLSTVGDRS